ncbi:helix-turn-helix transcriptional regulator [Desulfovibrio sp. JY]|nr:helix-turn-helix transcriptional regulator [Desulfovibrio sp. JY]
MLSSNLEKLMSEKEWTVRALAEATRLAPQTIMRARGDMIGRCTLDTLATIAVALGVRTKDLYEEE